MPHIIYRHSVAWRTRRYGKNNHRKTGIVKFMQNPVAGASRLQLGEIAFLILARGKPGQLANQPLQRRPAMWSDGSGFQRHPPATNAPHGIGKPTANCDLTPLATANGYRLPTGGGVVNQAWRPGKTGD